MELIINQSSLDLNFKYTVIEENKEICYGKANRIIIPNFRKIEVFNCQNKNLLSIKQESLLRIILKYLPIISFWNFSVCPYNFYCNGAMIGYMKEEYNGSSSVKGKIFGEFYEIVENTGECVSIYRSDKQVGLIKRRKSKIGDGDKYELIFNNNFNKELAISICILADVLWHTSDKQIYSEKLEFSTKIKGRPFNLEWKPED